MKRQTVYTQIPHNNHDWYCNPVNVEIRDMRWNRCDERVQLPSGIVTDSPSKSRPIGIFVSDGDDFATYTLYILYMVLAFILSKQNNKES
jgi:hypothetical protein